MNWLNSWASGIVVSVIIATLIEMLLPETKNKKYIKTIIGIFVLFSIIAPAVSNFTNTNIDFAEILASNSEYGNYLGETEEIDTDKTILETYENKLKEEIKTKIKNKGYEVTNINLTIDDTEENYGIINKIELKVSKIKDSENIEKVEKVEINISKKKEETEIIGTDVINELREYLADSYQINKENIIIN